jgi:hypothetical protein
MAPIEPPKTIKQFCEFEGFSEGYYFAMRKRGEGPDETRAGRRVTISPESHKRWRRRFTRPGGQPVAPLGPGSITEPAPVISHQEQKPGARRRGRPAIRAAPYLGRREIPP